MLAETGAETLTGSRIRQALRYVRGNTFFAYLELERGSDRLLVDARPSDAIALALRTRTPVLVNQDVLERARSAEVTHEQADQERLQRWLESLDPDEMGYKM